MLAQDEKLLDHWKMNEKYFEITLQCKMSKSCAKDNVASKKTPKSLKEDHHSRAQPSKNWIGAGLYE